MKIDRGEARAVPMRARGRLRRLMFPALLVVAVAIVALFSYNWLLRAPVAVETASVSMSYPSQAYTELNATGYVVAQRKAAVASKATGRLVWLGVEEGSRVKEGEIIARLENLDVKATREQAAANLQVANANLEQGLSELRDAETALKRSEELLAQGFVSRASHDIAVARHDKAKANIASLKAGIAAAQANLRGTDVAVEQTLIRAPFDGVVLTKAANVGDVVTPFSSALDAKGAVVTMADMSTLEVEADVSESNLSRVRIGQPVEIQLDALPDVRFRGVVARTVPTVDRSKATVMTKIRFLEAEARILPEMSAKVAFLSQSISDAERAPRAALNAAALTTRAGRNVVFVVRDSKVAEVPVETGAKMGDLIEIRSGPQPGEKVVLRPSAKLHDGAAVKPAGK
ncbi:MAG TPA: efflux RND transporter periplasmic adaptor subunit [Burkholderiales bacterium]|nr:efflux RND transporter periplasmic adaptor subunit [Burkholderiales bacterium]